MDIHLTDQADHFDQRLAILITKPLMQFDKSKLREKTTVIDIAGNLDQVNLDFFFNYNIFPPDIMAFRTQWQKEKRKMSIGDTILQQAYPSRDMIFG